MAHAISVYFGLNSLCSVKFPDLVSYSLRNAVMSRLFVSMFVCSVLSDCTWETFSLSLATTSWISDESRQI